MGLGLEWIPEEHQNVNSTFGNPGTQLLISAKWSTAKTLDRQTGVLLDHSASGTGADENMPAQFGFVFGGPLQHFIFHVVVGDKSNALDGGTFNVGHDHSGHGLSVAGLTNPLDSAI